MIGISIESCELWETLEIAELPEGIALQIDAEITRSSGFMKKIRNISATVISVRNIVAPRLNRLILESGSKLQNDYLESLGKSFQLLSRLNADKVILDFDLSSVLQDALLTAELKRVLCSIKGMAYEAGTDIELLFRLPMADMESFIFQAAFFRSNSMLGMNYSVDIHIHEAAFDRENICAALHPVQYDIGSMNFVYDAALGNKINPSSLKKTVDFMRDKGVDCCFFLTPSGDLNYHTIRDDAAEWFDIFLQNAE